MEEYDGSYPDTYVWEEKNNETLEVKDSLIYVGDNWKAEDNFVSATDKEGNTLSVSDVVIEGIVDTDNVGEYDITYKNGSLSKVAKVTVKKRKVTTRPDIIVGTVYENTQLNTNFYGYLGNIGTSFPERDTYPEFHTGSNREGFIVPNNLVTTYTLKNNTKFWSYTIKVDRKLCVIICLLRHKNERTFMSGFKRYDEEFKQSL
ncbi:bacterial Ig-like domain-containing protein, partial [Lactococcus petauri]